MANKRIIDLTAAGSLALTDVLEIDTGTLSLKVTGQQVYNLIAAQLNAANPLVLGNGNLSINSLGEISGPGYGLFSDGGATFNGDVNCATNVICNSVNCSSIAVGVTSAAINNDGSAFFLGASQFIQFNFLGAPAGDGFVIDIGDRAGNDFQVKLDGTVVGADALWGITPIGAATFLSVQIGSGTTISKVLSTTAVLDFGSTAAGSSSDLTITLTGAALGDTVMLGVPNASTLANGVFTAWVSSANTVKVRFTNTNLVTALDPASGTFRVTIIQF